jgi:hypothetical protein
MTAKRRITEADVILDLAEYEKVRPEKRRTVLAAKRDRRLSVGPFATFYFESYETIWWQVHEMLRIERGGAMQLPDELAAYNPLIPNGGELVATIMFEIDDPLRRNSVLGNLGGIEETVFLRFAGQVVEGVPEEDVDRTSAEGKASAVQFVHFPFTPEQIDAFRKPDTEVIVGFKHPQYGHMAVMPEATRAALAGDFD